jgi:predicted nucleic acid-binding protein
MCGVLGILLRAKAMGEIVSIKSEIEALRSHAGFFVASSLEAEVLRTAGEQ